VPAAAVVVVESVSVVPQVAVHVESEKEADTPAGSPEAANETATGLPEVRVAVMLSVTELPCVTESDDGEAESEMAGGRAAAAIVRATVVVAEGADPVPVTAIL